MAIADIKKIVIKVKKTTQDSLKKITIKNIYDNIKNPKTEASFMMKRVLMGLGICSVSLVVSMMGFR